MTQLEEARQLLHSGLLWAPVSAGELLDKVTILELKTQRLSAPSAVANAARELALLREICEQAGLLTDVRLSAVLGELREVNGSLWHVEDALREHEQRAEFDETFVALARSVYQHNDRRAALKRAINEALGSVIREEKSYGRAPSRSVVP